MKAILIILAVVFTMSFAGSASGASVVEKSQTENVVVSKATGSSASNTAKAKKAHHKGHKKGSGKKTKK